MNENFVPKGSSGMAANDFQFALRTSTEYVAGVALARNNARCFVAFSAHSDDDPSVVSLSNVNDTTRGVMPTSLVVTFKAKVTPDPPMGYIFSLNVKTMDSGNTDVLVPLAGIVPTSMGAEAGGDTLNPNTAPADDSCRLLLCDRQLVYCTSTVYELVLLVP
jgi:hypothetical protein